MKIERNSETKGLTSSQIVRSVWNNEFFVLFMKFRFPNEKCKSYIGQWKHRLQADNPFVYMDEMTLRAYRQAIAIFCLERLQTHPMIV